MSPYNACFVCVLSQPRQLGARASSGEGPKVAQVRASDGRQGRGGAPGARQEQRRPHRGGLPARVAQRQPEQHHPHAGDEHGGYVYFQTVSGLTQGRSIYIYVDNDLEDEVTASADL